jgi:signal transduction histidine kinase
MSGLSDTLLWLAPSFARAADRASAWEALAQALACDGIVFFTRDPELNVLLPAPGLPQTLHHADAWRAFIDGCRDCGERIGAVPTTEGSAEPARCIFIDGGAVAVLTGSGAAAVDPNTLVPLLTVLKALFDAERRADAEAARAAAAGVAVERARGLTRTVQAMRDRLEASLREAQAAREAASEHAAEAHSLAQEMQAQAAQMEEQALELELLNEDLSDRTVEAERARAAADLANRAKSEFLANMSHELRTPINAIMGYTEIIDLGIAGAVSPEQRVHLERVRASSRHLLTLVNDLLDTAKIEAGHMTVRREPGSIADAVGDAVGLLAVEAGERGVTVEATCPADVGYCGDADRVRQIVINLLSNAIKFTAAGGRVALRASTEAHAPEGVAVSGEGPWMCLQVDDTGIGMSEEEVEKVFRPFVQADSSRTRVAGGTGLGLTISRQLARLMGGDLTARSEPGRGSRFTVWLPAAEARVGTLDASIRVSSG